MNFKGNGRNDAGWQACAGFCRLLLFFFASGLWLASAGRAQVDYATGTLRGTVLDAQGAFVPSAKVTITNPATGATRGVLTSSEGTYQVSALNPGTYEVHVEAAGFETLVAKGVVLTVGQIAVYDARLKIGTANEVVEVTYSSAPTIDVGQTQQANTINERQVENLPNISRNFAQSIYTLPGVVDSAAPSIQDPNIGLGYQTSGFSIGGSNGRSNLFTVDGGENDFGSGAQRVVHIPLDSVQEFQVNRNSFAPEFGFTVGTAINVITKSGTNKYHGSAFIYFHDQHTDAANFFNSFSPGPPTKPFEQSAIYGGTFGGPIKKDKLFFFTSYERQKLDSSVVINLLQTAAAQGVAGQTNGFDPVTGACPAPVTQACYLTQLATNGGPGLSAVGGFFFGSSIFNPLKDPIYTALISPNSGTFDGNAAGGAVQASSPNGRYHNWVSRVDFQPNAANAFSLRFSLLREGNKVTGAGGAPRTTSTIQELRDYTITSVWSHVFNSNVVNTARVQVVPYDTSNNVAPFPGRSEIDLGSLGIQGTPFSFPYLSNENRFQFDEDLAWTKGTHSFKFGASYRPVQYSVFEQLTFGGQFQYFDGAIPIIALVPGSLQGQLVAFNINHGYAPTGPASTNLSASQTYVAGIPIVLFQGSGNGQYDGTLHYAGFYAQDAWRASRNVTVNYGARLDYDKEPNSYPSSVYVSPRLGIAWNPGGDSKTVIRAGGGLFVAPVLFIVPFTSTLFNVDGQHIFVSLSAAPGQLPQLIAAAKTQRALATVSNPNPTLTLAQLAAAGIPLVPPGPNQVGGAFFTVAPNFKPQYAIQGSLSVAREIAHDLSLEVAYQFYHSVHIQQNQEANFVRDTTKPINPFIGPFYTAKPGFTNGEPNANVLQNDQTASIGSSVYHGMTASLTKRFGRGLQFQANYTFSKAIDNTSDYSSQSTPYRPDLLAADRAVSDFNIKHSFVANAVYNTPFHRGAGGLMSAVLADISISPIVSVRTGVPFTLLVPGIGSNGSGGHFSEARPFHEGRNNGIGPGYATFDMRVSKALYLKKDSGLRLQLIAEATNILNHTNFNRVNNIFPPAASVPTGSGTVNLLNGPYNFKGFVPNGPTHLTDPLAFQSAALPRQISFGVELSF